MNLGTIDGNSYDVAILFVENVLIRHVNTSFLVLLIDETQQMIVQSIIRVEKSTGQKGCVVSYEGKNTD